jgi:hypothetical protein
MEISKVQKMIATPKLWALRRVIKKEETICAPETG